MDSYKNALRNIDRLESMIPSEILMNGYWDFRALWRQIKITGESFKGVRFPNPDQHERAWSRFQDLVQKVKTKQNERHSNYERRREQSKSLRNSFVRRAGNVLPDSAFGDIVIGLMTGGLSLMVDALLGEFDQRKSELAQASRTLKNIWDDFRSQKGQLLREDKDTVYHALKNTQSQLDDLWAEYKAERQSKLDAHYQEKRQRHEQWRERTLGNVRNNQERQSRLSAVLEHKRRHVGTLHDKLAEARSDDYRTRVESWISEEEAAIRDIEQKVREIEGWISDDLSKLES